jgi:flagellar basal body-associated protein FliL
MENTENNPGEKGGIGIILVIVLVVVAVLVGVKLLIG